MTFKIIDTREKPAMSKKHEEALYKAFEGFQPEGSIHIKTPQKEHLDVSFKESLCCGHAWQPIPPAPETTKFLQATFEETDLGNAQKICSICGALSLWENGQLFAYDAIANAEKNEEKPERKSNKRERR
jgi:hypothetical protein